MTIEEDEFTSITPRRRPWKETGKQRVCHTLREWQNSDFGNRIKEHIETRRKTCRAEEDRKELDNQGEEAIRRFSELGCDLDFFSRLLPEDADENTVTAYYAGYLAGQGDHLLEKLDQLLFADKANPKRASNVGGKERANQAEYFKKHIRYAYTRFKHSNPWGTNTEFKDWIIKNQGEYSIFVHKEHGGDEDRVSIEYKEGAKTSRIKRSWRTVRELCAKQDKMTI